ncbi:MULTISPECIES: hypothetical protein [unclassified Sulfitobacter]|uniref:hypothetical protein n=1 Tax=unclassified Sulfitobacter TaxID=196795 RepID=UPI0007C210EC|nr:MULTISPECIES: hypothetical protein [unclassified Sulfitobacter]KZY05231.1 hypothetical protein A3721_14970 [Sulfitobacter sp. HI0023]KZY25623.1 hypothetical protein A3728_18360 [Sulfitobacter sp. HI0040]KZZ66531.1 hypothetical protein A3764_16830 [Sulfitobacter sp. HI0129]
MKINTDTAEGGGLVEVETTEDGMVLLSWLSANGETFRWWKLGVEQAEDLGDIIKNHARKAAEAAPTHLPEAPA